MTIALLVTVSLVGHPATRVADVSGAVFGSTQTPAVPAIDTEDPQKLTALMRASAKGDLKAVTALLAKGANPNMQSSEQGVTALMCAAYFGHLDVVQVLVAKGAKVDLKGGNGGGPIDWAVAGGHKAVDQWLESKGTTLNPFLNLFSFPVWFMDQAAAKAQ
jgi:ankyrin repeat protein